MIRSRKFKIRFTCLMCDQTMVTDETESQNQLRVVNREFFFMHTIKTRRRKQTITIIISVDSIGTHSAWQQGMMNNRQTNTCFEFTALSFKYFDCMRKIDKICHWIDTLNDGEKKSNNGKKESPKIKTQSRE